MTDSAHLNNGTSNDKKSGDTQLAAVDLGSNSFHMIVAQEVNGELRMIDKIRDSVRLANGLGSDGKLSDVSMETAMDCLARFAQRIKGITPERVRVVGTNTLRHAKNARIFRVRAEKILGSRIEVIAGREEARLVYLGVAHGLAANGKLRLVVDIGGGSTELIVGKGFDTVYRESTEMGCVRMTRAYFADGSISKEKFKRAIIACRRQLEPLKLQFKADNWGVAIGSSGTIKAVLTVLQGYDSNTQSITKQGLKMLRNKLIAHEHADNLDMDGLTEDRKAVFAGGVAVLSAVFDALDIESMDVSPMALREGLLYDLLGRIHDKDVRKITVDHISSVYGVDQVQGKRVKQTALELYRQIAADWQLQQPELKRALKWSAQLHEVGLSISHSQYQTHSAYILEHCDMAGFSRQEQTLLSVLVNGHRRKISPEIFEALDETEVQNVTRLCVILRLAVLFNRARADEAIPVTLSLHEGNLMLSFPQSWLDLNPLTHADLEEEVVALQDLAIDLSISQHTQRKPVQEVI